MAVDLGDLYRLSFTLTAPGGWPASSGEMTLSVTLPDGTSTDIGTVAPVSTGVYQHDYLTTQSGRHVARWLGTGANPGAHVEAFDVLGQAPPYLISVPTAKRQLKITESNQDDEVRDYVEAASLVVERHLGEAIAPRPVTEQQEVENGTLILNVFPVISLVSLSTVDGSQTWDTSTLHPSSSGVVRIGTLTGWFRHRVTVTYMVGQPVVPANIRLATAIIVEHLWQSKRGTRGGPNAGGMQDTMMAHGLGYAIPNRALELLGTPTPGVA